jgi:hypothetical protein
MEPYRVPLKVYRYRPTGKRNVGRRKKRWKEQFYKNPGGGTDQLAQALKLLMTMMMMISHGEYIACSDQNRIPYDASL